MEKLVVSAFSPHCLRMRKKLRSMTLIRSRGPCLSYYGGWRMRGDGMSVSATASYKRYLLAEYLYNNEDLYRDLEISNVAWDSDAYNHLYYLRPRILPPMLRGRVYAQAAALFRIVATQPSSPPYETRSILRAAEADYRLYELLRKEQWFWQTAFKKMGDTVRVAQRATDSAGKLDQSDVGPVRLSGGLVMTIMLRCKGHTKRLLSRKCQPVYRHWFYTGQRYRSSRNGKAPFSYFRPSEEFPRQISSFVAGYPCGGTSCQMPNRPTGGPVGRN